MVNEKKIRLMTQLSRYEENDGKEDLKIMKYYRSDYLGVALLKNFFLTTLGYGIILILVFAYFSDHFLNNMNDINLILLAVVILGGYVIMLTLYSVITYSIYSLKYSKVKRKIQYYDQKLTELSDLYGKEECMKNQRQENRRGSK